MEGQNKKKKAISYAKWGYIFIIPFFVVYFIFSLYPQLLTIYNSFFENYRDGLTQIGPTFVGLANYIKLLSPGTSGQIDFLRYLGNTLIMWIIGAIPQLVIALLLALVFTSARLNIKGQGPFKSIMYMPNMIMAAAFSMLFFSVFNTVGPINQILAAAGIIDKPIDFISMKWSARLLVAFMNFLMWFGNTTIMFIAGIQGIDESMFESARIDGANAFKVLKDITLPLLKPIIVYICITSLIGGMKMFDVPQVLSKGVGMPDRTTFTVVMLLNNYLGGSKNYGMAGAVSVLLFIVTAILSIIVFKYLNRKE